MNYNGENPPKTLLVFYDNCAKFVPSFDGTSELGEDYELHETNVIVHQVQQTRWLHCKSTSFYTCEKSA